MSESLPPSPGTQGTPGTQTPLWLISSVGAIGLFASSVYLPSIPAMAIDFDVPVSAVQVTVTVYLAAMALSGLVVGPLSDRLGRRRVGLATMSILLAGSIAAFLATSIQMLIVARLVQGIGASGGIVLSRSMVRDSFTGRSASKASAHVAMAASIAPMLAPVIGGYIQQALGWRTNLLLVAALVSLLWVVALVRLVETLSPQRRYIGSALSVIAGYSGLLRMRRFMVHTLPIVFGAIGIFSYQTEAPVLMIGVLGVAPADYGIFAAMPAVGFLCGTFITSRVALRVASGTLIEYGCMLYIASGAIMLGLALVAAPNPYAIAVPMILFGAGNGLVIPSASIGGMSALPYLAGAAAALATGLRMGAGSLGSLVITALPSNSALALGGVVTASGIVALLSWVSLGRGRD
jgi:DHA1 family bicyclomycin/chloramphenicol resistance-like MFS transporter